jgi:hypothetical protein
MVDPSVPCLIGYNPNDEVSMERALKNIVNIDRGKIENEVGDWSGLCEGIIGKT